MVLFVWEFIHFFAAMIAIVLGISAASLFYKTYQSEYSTKTVWRSLGFATIVVAFLLLILERKYPFLAIGSAASHAVAFILIYIGILTETSVSQLKDVVEEKPAAVDRPKDDRTKKLLRTIITLSISVGLFIGGLFILGFYAPSFGESLSNLYVLSIVELVALVAIALSLPLQIKRYRKKGQDPVEKRVNLYPLLAYVFFFIRAVALIAYRLPDTDLVIIRELNVEYGMAWIVSVIAAILGFAFLFRWVWEFIKVRVFLRTYVVFLSIAVLVATISALVFSLFIFRISERNNIDLMLRGSKNQQLLMQNRADTATLIAKLLARDRSISGSLIDTGGPSEEDAEGEDTDESNTAPPPIATTASVSDNDSFGVNSAIDLRDKTLPDDVPGISDRTEFFFDNAGVDILRIYNVNGTVIDSPSDFRDVDRSFPDDKFLRDVLVGGQTVQTFDLIPGVLAEKLVTRSILPIDAGGTVAGAVEVGYIFDNAFLDFSKDKTGLDATTFAGTLRSSSTIHTEDDVSRWVGSNETNDEVLTRVLNNGEEFGTELDRLGVSYYSSFTPVRDQDNDIIGMVGVGTPAFPLLEAFRQNLLTTFVVALILSFVAAIIGYYAIVLSVVGRASKDIKKKEENHKINKSEDIFDQPISPKKVSVAPRTPEQALMPVSKRRELETERIQKEKEYAYEKQKRAEDAKKEKSVIDKQSEELETLRKQNAALEAAKAAQMQQPMVMQPMQPMQQVVQQPMQMQQPVMQQPMQMQPMQQVVQQPIQMQPIVQQPVQMQPIVQQPVQMQQPVVQQQPAPMQPLVQQQVQAPIVRAAPASYTTKKAEKSKTVDSTEEEKSVELDEEEIQYY